MVLAVTNHKNHVAELWTVDKTCKTTCALDGIVDDVAENRTVHQLRWTAAALDHAVEAAFAVGRPVQHFKITGDWKPGGCFTTTTTTCNVWRRI